MNRIIVNPVLCNGCQTCYKACFADVIRWDKKNRKPIAAYPRECVQCNFCQINCRQGALRVIPDYQSYPFPYKRISMDLK